MRNKTLAIAGASTIALSALTFGFSYVRPASTKKTTLVVEEWTNPPAIKATNVIDAAFEKLHPGVTIKFEYAPTAAGAWSTLTDTLLQSKKVDVLAEFAPGNFVAPAYMHQALGGVQALAAAHELVNFKGMPFMKDFKPGVQQQAVGYKGGIYGVEMASYGNTGVFYNTALFAKYHLSVPTTWNQFVHVCQVFQAHGVNAIDVAGKDGLEAMIWNAIMNAEFPHINATKVDYKLDDEFFHGKTSWNAPIWRKITERYDSVVKYFEPDWTGVAQLSLLGQWAAAGTSAMLVDGSWDGYTLKTANPKLHYSWFPIPGSNKPVDNRLVTAGDFTWVVPTWAAQKNLAVQYVEFFSQPKNYRIWENYVGSFPTENVSSTLPWMTIENQYLKAGKTTTGLGITTPNNAGSLAYLGNDLTELQPSGPYTVPQLQQLATKEYQSAAKLQMQGKAGKS